MEDALAERVQETADHLLSNAVGDCGNTQGSGFPCVSFGDNWVGVLFIAVFVAVFATLVVFFFFVAGMRVLCEHHASGAHCSASRS